MLKLNYSIKRKKQKIITKIYHKGFIQTFICTQPKFKFTWMVTKPAAAKIISTFNRITAVDGFEHIGEMADVGFLNRHGDDGHNFYISRNENWFIFIIKIPMNDGPSFRMKIRETEFKNLVESLMTYFEFVYDSQGGV